MSNEFVLSLAGIAVALLAVRLLVPAVPPAGLARRITPAELAVTVAGLAGLLLHCGAMFFEPVVAAIPGTGPVIGQINGMGTASMLWYAVPAVLLLAGLRRQQIIAVVVLSGHAAGRRRHHVQRRRPRDAPDDHLRCCRCDRGHHVRAGPAAVVRPGLIPRREGNRTRLLGPASRNASVSERLSAGTAQWPNGSGSTPGIQVSPGTPQPFFLACFMALRA